MAHEAVQHMLDAWEAQSDSDHEGTGGRKHNKRKRDRDSAEAATTWIRDDAEAPLDFMSADAAHSILTVRPSQAKRQRGDLQGDAGAENRTDALRRHNLAFAPDGRLVVKEDAEVQEVAEGAEPEAKAKPLSRLAEKRQKAAREKAEAKVERRRSHLVKGLDSYKPGKKSAQGDARRKGTKIEPYAYVSLNPKIVKEKFKSKAIQSFTKVVGVNKQGIKRGGKAKEKEIKLRLAKIQRQKSKPKRVRKPNAR
jgi:hypothetical protein